MVRRSITVPDRLDDAVDDLATESKIRDDVPDVSKAQIYRELWLTGATALVERVGLPDDVATDGGDEAGDVEALLADVDDATITDVTVAALTSDGVSVEDILDDRTVMKYRREEVKEDNWIPDIRGGFETRVEKELMKRWRNGYRGDDLARVAQGFIAEARVLWPDEGHDDRREDAIAYVEETVETLQQARDASEHDPLDVEEAVSHFSGMEDVTETGETLRDARTDAHDLLTEEPELTSVEADYQHRAEDVVEKIQATYAFDEPTARQVVREAADPTDREVSLDD